MQLLEGRKLTKAIAIFSGGLDSTTMVYQLKNIGFELDLVSFYYGQRHAKELTFAAATAEKLGMQHDIVDLSGLAHLLAPSGSSLVSDTDVPDGHYAEDSMKATVVPNRNMIMLSIATGIAVARGAECIATGVHAGDHFIYPDCRPMFIDAMDHAVRVANEGFGAWPADHGSIVVAPYLYSTKEDIASMALSLGVPLDETWSCYKGGDIHCGTCGTCVERLEAIDGAIARQMPDVAVDPTQYKNYEFWRTATVK